LALAALSLTAGPASSAPTLPAGFETVTLTAGLTRPIAIDWAPDGRMFIAEKAGDVKVVNPGGTTSQQILDISGHVNSQGDRGLTGIAVDRDFATNGYLWLLYTYENNPAASGAKTARLTRVTVKPDNTIANPGAPETAVLGKVSTPPCPAPSNTSDCFPEGATSHINGTVRSDPADGTLWVGNGDGFSSGGFNPNTYDEQSFAGKLIHVDRQGSGVVGHPMCASDNDLTHVCTKIYAKGFRNPFRFTLRSGKGPVAADVGWNTREEVDLPQPGKNYGWPCYEGSIRTPGFENDSRCATLYSQEGTPAGATFPAFDCSRSYPCQTLLAGPTYTARAYPSQYWDDVFFGDYSRGWLKRLKIDAADNVTSVVDFATNVPTFVDLELAPNGNLTYVNIGDFTAGTGSVDQIRSTTSNRSPVARASADKTYGPTPLNVQFTGSTSSDPDGDTLTYDWDFGDGSTHSSAANPTHPYNDGSRNFTATLTVRDGKGGSDSTSVLISPGNTPPTIDSLNSPATYRDGVAVNLTGAASDTQDGQLGGTALSWSIRLAHGNHFHDLDAATGTTTSFTPLEDHDADSHYDVTLTATDNRGLTDSRTVSIQPETVQFTLASSPAGASVSYDGVNQTAPYTKRSAIGFQTPISAAFRFRKDGTTYEFQGWSDTGARLHDITIPSSDTTLTATYREAPPSAYRDAVVTTPGLLSYWRLGEALGTTANDEFGGHDGTYSNGVTLGRQGALASDLDTAAGFNGLDGEMTAGGAGLPLGSTGTIEGWFFWENGVALMRDSTTKAGWILAYESAGQLAYRVGGTTFVTARTTASVQNAWHHFALTASQGSAALYVDGARVHSGSGAAGTPAAMPWRLMHNGTFADQFTRGSADEVAVYSSALSAATIAEHYQIGHNGGGGDPAPAAPRSLTASPGDRSARLDWQDNTESDLGGYDVYRSTSAGGPYTKLNSALLTSSDYTDSGLQNGTTYFYVVKASDRAGHQSGASNEAQATPRAAGSPYRDAVLATAGLRAYWRLGEASGATAAADEKGQSPGSYLGGVALGQPGALTGDPNTAAGFDGVNDEMSASGTGLALGSAGTLEGWFYWQAGVALMRDSTTKSGWIVAYDSAGQLAYRVAGKSFVTTRTTASVQNGWHHFVVTDFQGATALYVDGVRVHQGSGAPAIAATQPWRVMRNGSFAGQFSRGRADEVAIYDQALSAAQVAQHYQAGAG
jgi:PKD repeat protein/glucose/arabinose dehydrogenase